jgi:hypothetical protein
VQLRSAFIEFLFIYPGIPIATAAYANRKGYSARWWLLYSMILPVVTLIILYYKKPNISGYRYKKRSVQYTISDKVIYSERDETTNQS